MQDLPRIGKSAKLPVAIAASTMYHAICPRRHSRCQTLGIVIDSVTVGFLHASLLHAVRWALVLSDILILYIVATLSSVDLHGHRLYIEAVRIRYFPHRYRRKTSSA